jgi:hypothetical protein
MAYSRKVPTPPVHQHFGELILSTGFPRRTRIELFVVSGLLMSGSLGLFLFAPFEALPMAILLLLLGLVFLLIGIFRGRPNVKPDFWIYERGMIVAFRSAAEEIPYNQLTQISDLSRPLRSQGTSHGELVGIDFRFAFYLPDRRVLHFHLPLFLDSHVFWRFLRVLQTMSSHLPAYDYSAYVAEHLDRLTRGQ